MWASNMLHHFTEKIQAAERELFLMQSALERAVNSLISSTVCTIELEAPVAKSMLTMNVHAHKVGDALDQGCCFSSSANGPPVLHPRPLFLCTAHKLIIYAPDSMITTPTPGRLLVMLEQLPSTTRSLSFLT